MSSNFCKISIFALLSLVLMANSSHIQSMEIYNKVTGYLSRNKGIIAAGLGAAAAVGALYYGYNHGAFNTNSVIGINYSNSDRWAFNTVENRHFADQSTIKIENGAGLIDVSGYDGDTIELAIHKRGATQRDLDNVSAEITESERHLSVKTQYHQSVVQALINYKLRVPRNKIISLAVSNSSGDISAQEIKGIVRANASSGDIKIDYITGDAFCNSSSGDIKALKIGRNCEAESSSGQITVSANGDVVAQSSSGDIHVTNKGKFNANVSSGTIFLNQEAINAPIRIQTSSGDVTLSARSINGQLTAKTSSGDFRSDFALNNTVQGKLRKKLIKSQVGAGGAAIDITTSSGDIVLWQLQ